MSRVFIDLRTKGKFGLINRFTLIELMVVLSIILILFAFLLPVLNSAMKKINEAICVSKTMDLQKIAFEYSGDYNDFLPSCRVPNSTAPWYKGTFGKQYISNNIELTCPEGAKYNLGIKSEYAIQMQSGYGSSPGAPDYVSQKRLSNITHPSNANYFLESVSVFAECKYWKLSYVTAIPNDKYIRGGYTQWRHSNSMACSFLDGHSEMRTDELDFGSYEDLVYFGLWKY